MIPVLAAVASSARADEPWSAVTLEPIGEEWGDGLTLRPVRTTAAVLEAVTPRGGAVAPTFGSLSLQLATPVDATTSFGVALDGRVVSAPTELGTVTGLQSLGGEAWLTVEAEGTRHGLGLIYGEPTGAVRGWYLYHPIEGGRRVVGVYDATFDLGRFDLAFDLRLGGGTAYAVQLGGTLGGVVELERHVALSVVMQAMVAPDAVFRVGVDLRPVDGVELDLGLGVPVAYDDRTTREVQPGVIAKLWR